MCDPLPITAVNKTANYIIAGGAAWFYDDGDSFKIVGVPKTAAAFEAELSSGDNIDHCTVHGGCGAGLSVESHRPGASRCPRRSLAGPHDGYHGEVHLTTATGATSVNVYRALDGVTPVLRESHPGYHRR